MITRLAGGFSAALIVVVLCMQLKDHSEPRTLTADTPERTDRLSTGRTPATTLASSTIAPIFVPHTLPVANMADVAADVFIESRDQNTDPAGQNTIQDIENGDEDSVEALDSVMSDVIIVQADSIADDPSKHQRSAADVAFLRQSLSHDSNSAILSVAQAVAGITAIRTSQTGHDKDSAAGPSTLEPSALIKASTAYQHLHDFKGMLTLDGFQRPDWQDMTFNPQLGVREVNTKPFVVVIDPGHGGSDPGARGHNGLLEKDLTLDIARRVRLFLTEVEHIDVQLTRHHDYGLSRQSRVDAITRSAADMVISLHFNHLPQTNVNLVESFYAGRKNIEQSLSTQKQSSDAELHRAKSTGVEDGFTFTEGSARLAKTLQQHIFSEVSFDNENVQNAGVKQKTLFVLTQSFTPSTLIEISCLSHAEEADRLASEEYRNRLAAALVDGIRNYYEAIQRVPLKTPGSLGA